MYKVALHVVINIKEVFIKTKYNFFLNRCLWDFVPTEYQIFYNFLFDVFVLDLLNSRENYIFKLFIHMDTGVNRVAIFISNFS